MISKGKGRTVLRIGLVGQRSEGGWWPQIRCTRSKGLELESERPSAMVESHTMCNNIQDNAAAQSTGEIIMGRRSRLRMPSNYRRTMKQPLFFCILLCMAPIHQSFSLQLLPIRMKPALRLAFNEGTELSSHVGDSARCPAEAPSSTSSQAPSANSISKEAELETSRLRGGSLLSEMSQDLIRDSSLRFRFRAPRAPTVLIRS